MSSRMSVVVELSAESGATWTYHVGATRFIISTKPPPVRAVEQVVEHLEDRQVRLGPGEPLGAFAAGDDRPVRTALDLGEHLFRRGSLFPMPASPDDRAP